MADENGDASESTPQPPAPQETELITHWVTDSMDPNLIQRKENNQGKE